MSARAPRWARALLARCAAPSRVDEVVGDLDEAHRLRVERHGRVFAALFTSLEAIDMATALRKVSRSQPIDVASAVRRRGLPLSWLDFKLGMRMLVRYPGLTLVAGFAMAFTVWVGAGTFELVTQVLRPRIPLDEGDRIVALQLLDRRNGNIHRHAGLDFLIWRETLESVEDLGAVRSSRMNLTLDGEIGDPIIVAAMTASGFDLARVPPQLGRFLLPPDETDGAAPVVVLSHDLWQRRFAADTQVVGRVVRLGNDLATIIGVMPEEFGFPFVQNAWTALRTSALRSERREAMPIQVFGRLRDGITSSELEAEMSLHVPEMAAAFPETHGNLIASVQPHGVAFLGLPPDAWSNVSLTIWSFNVIPVLLLLLIASNVALLMFARAATRESEIVVRTALGAGRARIVGQLFAESLVLGALAAGVGLSATSVGLRWALSVYGQEMMDGTPLPFWFHASLSPITIMYASVLTLVAATLSGVLPGLKVTRALADRLRESSTGGGGLQFGGIWAAVIVAQVAITIPFPAVVLALRGERAGIEEVRIDVPVDQYLSFRVELETPGEPDRAALGERYAATVEELERRLEADPRVRSVTTGDRLPRMYHPWRRVEVLEGSAEPPADDERGHVANPAFVAIDYFDALGAPILAGRGFSSADQRSDARVVVVNSSFVERVLGGRNAVGRHVRYIPRSSMTEPAPEEPWYEIVGVVPDLGTRSGAGPQGQQGIYHPLERSTFPIWVAAHVPSDPLGFVPDLRAVAQSVDPALEIHELMSLAEVVRADVNFYDFWITLIVFVSVIALVLSLAGIYAAMSFAVTRRTREIGIRVALGADRRALVWSVFRRPLLQLGAGAVLGTMLTAFLFATAQDPWIAFVAPYAALMTCVSLLACVVPTRRALGIEPSEALRSE
jgi:predicted permease